MPAKRGRRREVQPEEGQQQYIGLWPAICELLEKNPDGSCCCCLELAFIAFVVLAVLLLWLMGVRT
jgi:hypothetical protein